jgi:holo-[acyl-carrier protein] synthase
MPIMSKYLAFTAGQRLSLISKNAFTSMIYGTGIDIVKIARIKEISEKWGDKFLRRVFTDSEISYCYQKRNPYGSLAVRFAAKEALIKAIGSEVPVSFTDIEVINSSTGKPALKVGEKLETFFKSKSITTVHLSLSHEDEYGIASVVLEQ